MSLLEKLTGRTPENHILPFLRMNGEDEVTCRNMVRVIHELGMDALCAEPGPQLAGDEKGWRKALEILLDEASRCGMTVWIREEDPLPEGLKAAVGRKPAAGDPAASSAEVSEPAAGSCTACGEERAKASRDHTASASGGDVDEQVDESESRHTQGQTANGQGSERGRLHILTRGMRDVCFCESLGEYGWREGVRMDRQRVDHFLAEGCRCFGLHTFTCAPYPEKAGTGGGFGARLRKALTGSDNSDSARPCWYAQGSNPQYRHFGALMAYANRMCDLLSGEDPDEKTDAVRESEKTDAGNPKKIVTPGQEETDSAGMTDPAAQDFGALSDSCRMQGLLSPAAKGMTLRHYTGKREIYFLVNEAREDWNGHLMPEGWTDPRGCPAGPQWIIYNAWEDLLERPASDAEGLILQVPGGNSLVLVKAGQEEAAPQEALLTGAGRKAQSGALVQEAASGAAAADGILVPDAGEESFLPVQEVRPRPSDKIKLLEGKASEGAALYGSQEMLSEITRFARSACRAAEYPDFGKKADIRERNSYSFTDPKFSGFIRYEDSFVVPERALIPRKEGKKPCPNSVVLEITEAWEGVEVFVGGKSAGLRVSAPFIYDLTDLVKPGSNPLVIEVATTLDRERNGKKAQDPTGLTGRVLLYIRNR